MAASFLLLLTSVGLFLSAQAQNCPTPVGGPNMGLKENDILLQDFPDGTRVTFACDVGYATAGGSASITCTAGNWGLVRMKCERKSCGSFGDVPNGAVDYPEGNDFGDKLTITCNPGYQLVGKPSPVTIPCEDKGWNGRPPVCEVVDCDPPEGLTIGSFYPVKDTYAYRDVIQFSCPEPYTLKGSKSQTCSETGDFQPAAPECVKVDCKEPVVEFGHWDAGSRGPYTYKATVTFKCNEGYRMTNSPTITCGINEQWEPALPKCEEVHCKEPVVEFGQWDSGSQGPYTHKATVTFKCNEKYRMTNSPTITCGINEQWEPALPKCEAVPEVKTTTTKRPESTKKPTDGGEGPPNGGESPPNGGESISPGVAVGVSLAVISLVAAAVAICLWWYGLLKWPKKKHGSGTRTVVPTEEEVALGKRDAAAAP